MKKILKNPSQYKCVYEEKDGKEIFYDDYCNWQRIEEYKEFIFNSNIAKIAAQLMQSKKVNLFHEHILIKEPGATKRTHGTKTNHIIVLMEKIIAVYGFL